MSLNVDTPWVYEWTRPGCVNTVTDRVGSLLVCMKEGVCVCVCRGHFVVQVKVFSRVCVKCLCL